MKVLIVGYGVVGEATAELIQRRGDVESLEVHDPPKRRWVPREPRDVTVICTPCKTGTIDVFEEWVTAESTQVVVRSTLLPKAAADLPDNWHVWPEWLDEDTAAKDALTPNKVVWGTSNEKSIEVLARLAGWEHASRAIVVPRHVASASKLAINAHYAAKVALFNSLYDALDGDTPDYEAALEIIEADPRITVSHEQVWHKGGRGAGGKCLPKDVRLMSEASRGNGGNFWLEAVDTYHSRLRWLTGKE